MSARVVILAPNWLGDAVLALPAIADVRRALRGATLAVAARPSIAPLFAMVDGVDETITMSRGDHSALAGFDTALLLPNALRTAIVAWRAGVPERWGYRADGRRLLLTKSIARPARPLHQVDYYQHLVASLGFATGSTHPRLTIDAGARAAGAHLLTDAGWDRRRPLVALAPGAAYGSAKRWPAEYFAELAGHLADDGVGSVLVGSAADAPIAARVNRLFLTRRGAAPASNGRVEGPILHDVTGRTDLPTFAGLLTHCRALVTNDSGAMHLAAAAGVRVTAVFGPTRDRETRPVGERHAVLTHDVWCRPCMLRDCPLDHACMRGVTPSAAASAVRGML